MQQKDNKLRFEGQSIFIGIDVHLKSWTVTILLEHSSHKTFSQDPEAVVLAGYLNKNFPGANYFSAYEAGFCGFSTHEALLTQGIHNIVVNPADIPTTDKERQQKEDRRDSKKIAKCLRNGELEGIYIPNEFELGLRSLVRYRRVLVKEITRNKNRIKSFLYFEGITIPQELNSASRHWSNRFSEWLRSLSLKTEYSKMVINDFLDVTRYLRSNLLKIDRFLRAEYKRKGEVGSQIRLLRSVPGIGLTGGYTFLTEIGDITRFKNLDSLCSYLGLIPSTNSSGEKEVSGGITKRSNRFLRGMIIEASWVAIRIDPSMAQCFNLLCGRMQSNRAIIRIAKKLVSKIRYVLKNNTEYVCAI